MLLQYATVAVVLLLGIAMSGLFMGLGRLLRPANPSPGKLSTYECGEPPSGPAWINFNLRFYVIALVFVIFDVELAFLYPTFAVFRDWVLRGAGWWALVEVVTFVAILALGLAWVWGKGDLAWLVRAERSARPTSRPREAA
jgi:NADH-quinone oxidoreductase subunit A